MVSFARFYETIDQKLLIIMRGVSGAGKSTRARQLAGPQGIVLSSDDFFERTGDYIGNFHPSKVAEAHQWNLKRAEQAVQNNVSPVVIDNTNLMPYEAKTYVHLGQKYGYEVKIEEPQSEQWNKVLDLHRQQQALAQELAGKNLHGVPPQRVAQMLSQYSPYSIEDALNSKAPWET